MKIQILPNKKGNYFWRIVARNGKTLAVSEAYSSKRACEKTVAGVDRQRGGFIIEYL